MKKLLFKVYFMSFLSLLTIFMINAIAVKIIYIHFNGKINTNTVFWINIFSGFCALVIYTLLIDKIIIKRIKNLSFAIRDVGKGNFDVRVNDNGKDELSVLTKEFNGMTAELNSNEYLNKEFMKSVSHEIKTPLSAIKGFADLINGGQLTDSEVKEYAQIISSEALRMYDISKQMLNICLIDSSEKLIKKDNFRVDEQIRNIIIYMQKEWTDKNLSFDIEMEEITILSNEEQTYHIWQNLISNAIKFTPQNGNIKIRLYKKEDIIFIIEDNGIGISASDKEKVFLQFFTVDKTKSGKNTGLGLPLTKKIVEKLGGKIKLESKINEGTLITVTFPE